MNLVYDIGIRLYYIAALVSSLWNPKARKWVQGRKKWHEGLSNVFTDEDNIIWFHCASLGEFEQGRPLIEKVRSSHPEKKILLTFFSPSGYEKRKNYQEVDYVSYLPLDTRRNAKRMLELLNIEKVFFIKYEFWIRFLEGIRQNDIPLYLASGSFHPRQTFFKPSGKWYRKVLDAFTRLFIQDKSSADLLDSIGFSNYVIAGDTRYDRVVNITEQEGNEDRLFANSLPTLVAGSTWEEEELLIEQVAVKEKIEINIILAPHEPTEQHVNVLKNLFPDAVLYSEWDKGKTLEGEVLIVDTIGHLSSLYQYGDFAFIGGGFGKGIHNILEATAAGLPVIIGPNYQRFTEARELKELGGAFVVENAADLKNQVLIFMQDRNTLNSLSELVRNFTTKRTGATEIIYKETFEI